MVDQWLLREGQSAQAYGRALLLPVEKPPVPVPVWGKVVCTCFNVRDLAIEAQLQTCSGGAAGADWHNAKQVRCGTNCGSCLPELQRMVRSTAVSATPSTPTI